MTISNDLKLNRMERKKGIEVKIKHLEQKISDTQDKLFEGIVSMPYKDFQNLVDELQALEIQHYQCEMELLMLRNPQKKYQSKEI